ncbi:MAG: UpxY family transcription antiterminator [Candidatus Methylomirabilia bacterium]
MEEATVKEARQPGALAMAGEGPEPGHPPGAEPWAEARWYAVRTRSRHEKLVRDQLLGREIDVFLPIWEQWSRWKDRKKKVQFPLFPGYCFVRIPLANKLLVLRAVGAVDLVGLTGQPEPIPESEIEAIRTLVESRLRYDPHPYLTEGMEVEVVRGPLLGARGRLLRKDRATRLVLAVDLIRQAAAVEIDAADVTPV